MHATKPSNSTGADLEMAAWKRWRQLGQRLKDACSSCKEDTAAAAAASIDAASVPDATVAVGRGARQFNPLREAALRPGEKHGQLQHAARC